MNRDKIINSIIKGFQDYLHTNGVEPTQAVCEIEYLDDNTQTTETFMLSCSDDEDGYNYDNFYYCNSYMDLVALVDEGVESFVIRELVRYE